MLYIVLLWRLWAVVASILFLNSVAGFIFDPSKESGKRFLTSWPFILVWPLSLFSEKGRDLMFKRIQSL